MEIKVFEPHELETALGAIRAVVPRPSAAQDAFLRVLGRLHARSVEPRELPAPTPAETAAAITDPHRRKRLVECAIVMTMVDGAVEREAASSVASLARALGVDGRTSRTLRRVAARHRLLTRIDMSRRLFGRFVGAALREEGLGGVRRFVGAMLKVGEDPATAERFRAMGRLPPGSFGRAYWEHSTSRGFAFPGERGAIPERAVFHDFGHVLSGYDTDPAGEIQQAAFQAGFMRNEGFAFLFFGIMQFHLGIKLTPIAEAEVGFFDVEKVLAALARGASCNADLSDRWDPRPFLALPLEVVRERLGVPPLAGGAVRAA